MSLIQVQHTWHPQKEHRRRTRAWVIQCHPGTGHYQSSGKSKKKNKTEGCTHHKKLPWSQCRHYIEIACALSFFFMCLADAQRPCSDSSQIQFVSQIGLASDQNRICCARTSALYDYLPALVVMVTMQTSADKMVTWFVPWRSAWKLEEAVKE